MKISVYVKLRSTHSVLEQQENGTWIARLNAPPVDGKANKALMVMVARQFSVPRSSVSIVSGHRSKHKVVEIIKRET